MGALLLPIKGTTPSSAWSPSVDEAARAYFHGGWYLRDGRAPTIPKLLRQGVAIDLDGITLEEMKRNPFYQD